MGVHAKTCDVPRCTRPWVVKATALMEPKRRSNYQGNAVVINHFCRQHYDVMVSNLWLAVAQVGR